MADIEKTAEALRKRGYEVACFETGEEAANYVDSRAGTGGNAQYIGICQIVLGYRLHQEPRQGQKSSAHGGKENAGSTYVKNDHGGGSIQRISQQKRNNLLQDGIRRDGHRP